MLLDNFSDLFQRGLEYAWDSENLLVKHLTKMSEMASSAELKQLVDLHLLATKMHVYKLEQIFTRLDRAPAAEKNEPIRIIVEECEKMMGHIEQPELRDAAMLFCLNQIEHYEAGLYDSLSGMARELEKEEIATILDEILLEERSTVTQLTRLAVGNVNRAAKSVHNPPPFALI